MGSSDADASDVSPGRSDRNPSGGRTTLLLGVFLLLTLLLAGAAAVGVATFLSHRPATWRSTAVVRLVPGSVPASSNLPADVARYLSSGSTAAFAEKAGEDAGLPKAALRGGIEVQQRAPGQLGVVVHASTSDGARRLAESAGEALARLVRSDQAAREPRPAARLGAVVAVSSTEPIKTSPRTQDSALGAALGAGVVLVLATWVAAVQVSRRAHRYAG